MTFKWAGSLHGEYGRATAEDLFTLHIHRYTDEPLYFKMVDVFNVFRDSY